VISQIRRIFLNIFLNQKVAKFVLLGTYSIFAIVASSSNDIVSQMLGLVSIACIGFVLNFNLSKETDAKYFMTITVSVFTPLILFLRGFYVAQTNILASNSFHFQTLYVLLFIHFVWFFSIVFFDGNRREIIQKLNDLFRKS
jgi:hypothetical protein